MLRKHNIIYSFIMGLIFPGVFFLAALKSFSIMQPPMKENLLIALLLIGIYLILLLVGHFYLLKHYGNDFKRFLLMLYYFFATILLGIFFSWFIAEVIL